MKKLLFVLALVGFTSNVMAQETEVPEEKYSVATNSFWSNWFVTVGGAYRAFYSDEQHNQGYSNSPFKHFRRSYGFTVSLGKWYTPGIGTRLKFNGVWGKTVTSETCSENKAMNHYWNLNAQVLFNLSNLLFGYNSTRVWNLIPYAGGGVLRNMSGNNYAMTWDLGIMSTWRLTSYMDIYIEGEWVISEAHIDGESISENSEHSLFNYDRIFSAEIGLKFNLGKSTWEKTPDVDALMAMNKEQLDALNAALRDAQDENARLKALLAEANNKPAPKAETIVKKEIATTKLSVFFNINSSKIASKKDLVNVQELANYAKQNGSTVLVNGYADSATGTKAINNRLSEARANAVADELVKMGVSRDKITVKANGGVDELSPIQYNRRATVEIK